MDVYMDDLVLNKVGSRQEVLEDLVRASGDLVGMVEESSFGFGASVAMDKVAIAGSSKEVTNELRRRLGDIAGGVKAVDAAAVNLGIDFTPGAERGAFKHSKLRERLCKGLLRNRRIGQVRRRIRAGKARLSRIYVAGVKPGLGFGARVNGLSGTEVKQVRSILGQGMHPRAGGSSLTAKLAVQGHPGAELEVAPILAWHAEVWRAGNDLPGPHLSILELTRRWGRARAEEVKSWRRARGPLAAMALCMRRIGWSMASPTGLAMVDDQGNEVVLLQCGPKLFKKLLIEAVQRRLEVSLAEKLGMTEVEGEGGPARALVDVAQGAIRSKKRSPWAKGSLKSLLMDGLWTAERAVQAGYILPNVCPLCGAEGDSVEHRLWRCCHPAVKAAREEAAGKVLLEEVPGQEALEASADLRALWCRGLPRHPLPGNPGLQKKDGCRIWVGEEEHSELPGRAQGPFFWDGSADNGPIKALRRAGWGVVWPGTPGDASDPRVTVVGPVWAGIPQTSQGAEHCGILAAAQIATGPSFGYGDCKAVVEEWSMDTSKLLSAQRMHSGLWRAGMQDRARGHIEEVAWTKAHVLEKLSGAELALLSPEELWKARGNHLADKAADRGKECHPALAESVLERAGTVVRQSKGVHRVAMAVLPLFPRLPQHLERVPRPPRAARALKHGQGHDWGPEERGWRRCARCWVAARPWRCKEACNCTGEPKLLAKVHPTHMVRLFMAGHEQVVVCFACAAYGSRKALLLGQRCRAVEAGWAWPWGRKRAMQRVEAGRHPGNDRQALALEAWAGELPDLPEGQDRGEEGGGFVRRRLRAKTAPQGALERQEPPGHGREGGVVPAEHRSPQGLEAGLGSGGPAAAEEEGAVARLRLRRKAPARARPQDPGPRSCGQP